MKGTTSYATNTRKREVPSRERVGGNLHYSGNQRGKEQKRVRSQESSQKNHQKTNKKKKTQKKSRPKKPYTRGGFYMTKFALLKGLVICWCGIKKCPACERGYVTRFQGERLGRRWC